MIVQATGYQKGGIYQHFKSKMDLANACFWYNYRKLFSGYMGNISSEDSPKDQLKSFVKNYQYFVRNAPLPGGCPVLNTAIEADDIYEDLRISASEALGEWVSALVDVIIQGQEQSQFKSDVDPQSVAEFFIATVEGAIMMGKLDRNAKLMLKIGDQLIKYIDEILANPER